MTQLWVAWAELQIGRVGFASSEKGLRYLALPGKLPWKGETLSSLARNREAIRQVEEYLQGQRQVFTLLLDPQGTSFQQQVWQVLNAIPYGQTRSYTEVASLIQRPKAARAVGRAVGTNPLPIVIPCHRVLASDGSLGGYLGGLDLKRTLLGIEGLL